MPKLKIAVVVFAGTDTHEAMGRLANALVAVKEFKEAGDEVQLIFDGAAVQWPMALAEHDHLLHSLYQSVRDRSQGVCHFCAGSFKVKEQLEAGGTPLLDEFNGHPSFRKLVAGGYQVITF